MTHILECLVELFQLYELISLLWVGQFLHLELWARAIYPLVPVTL